MTASPMKSHVITLRGARREGVGGLGKALGKISRVECGGVGVAWGVGVVCLWLEVWGVA